MEQSNSNPVIVMLFMVLRCLVPLVLMLGVSYLLRRMGLIAPPPPPDDEDEDQNPHTHGGMTHE